MKKWRVSYELWFDDGRKENRQIFVEGSGFFAAAQAAKEKVFEARMPADGLAIAITGIYLTETDCAGTAG